MSRLIVRPHQLDFDSPGRRDYWVALEHDSIWGDHLIPLTVMVGPQAQAGRGLVAFGSNHGNEMEGPVVLKNLLREIKTADVLGKSTKELLMFNNFRQPHLPQTHVGRCAFSRMSNFEANDSQFINFCRRKFVY